MLYAFLWPNADYVGENFKTENSFRNKNEDDFKSLQPNLQSSEKFSMTSLYDG